MDAKSLASEITKAGADKVLERNPKRVDDAVVNTVIKQGANALESGASKGAVDPAIGAAAEVSRRQCQPAVASMQRLLSNRAHSALIQSMIPRHCNTVYWVAKTCEALSATRIIWRLALHAVTTACTPKCTSR